MGTHKNRVEAITEETELYYLWKLKTRVHTMLCFKGVHTEGCVLQRVLRGGQEDERESQDQDEEGGGAAPTCWPAPLREGTCAARRWLRPPRVQSWPCEAEGCRWLTFPSLARGQPKMNEGENLYSRDAHR